MGTDLCTRSMLLMLADQHDRGKDFGHLWRHHLEGLAAAVSDSAFLDHVDLCVFARSSIADKVSRQWWIAEAPSFDLAAMRIGVVEVERRTLGVPGGIATTDLEPYLLLPQNASSRVTEVVTATLATNNAHEPQGPQPGRNWVSEHRLKRYSPDSPIRWLLGSRTAHTPTNSGKSAIADALAYAYHAAWQARHRARSITGVAYRALSTRRGRQLDAMRKAWTSLRRNMFRRTAGNCCPGQAVTASPRVSRGPNPAREQPTRIHLWSAPAH